MVLNNNTTTRRPAAANQPDTSPDISLSSAHLSLVSTWLAHASLSSDHLPITISLPDDSLLPPLPKDTCYVNFHRADVQKFKEYTESEFENAAPPTSAAEGAAVFQRILLTGAKHAVPAE